MCWWSRLMSRQKHTKRKGNSIKEKNQNQCTQSKHALIYFQIIVLPFNIYFQNNVRLLNSAVINDFTMLTYRQPLRAVDAYDKVIHTNQSQAVIWAIGPVNTKV